MSETAGPHHASCHCGAVRLRVKLSDGFNTIRRCDCSFCRMRGAVVASALLSDLTILEGEDSLTLYQFNTGTAKHYFCKTCGIYTHHQRRSNPEQFGINVACIEGVSPFDFPEVTVMDGVRHPADTGADPNSGIAGVLRYSTS